MESMSCQSWLNSSTLDVMNFGCRGPLHWQQQPHGMTSHLKVLMRIKKTKSCLLINLIEPITKPSLSALPARFAKPLPIQRGLGSVRILQPTFSAAARPVSRSSTVCEEVDKTLPWHGGTSGYFIQCSKSKTVINQLRTLFFDIPKRLNNQ